MFVEGEFQLFHIFINTLYIVNKLSANLKILIFFYSQHYLGNTIQLILLLLIFIYIDRKDIFIDQFFNPTNAIYISIHKLIIQV